MSDEKPQNQLPAGGAPNFNELEQGILKFWDENKTFEKSLEQTKDGEPFIFYDGPPFATGLPHYGSILPSVIKDAIPRYQTMQGRFVRRRWGWDCHGLPIENLVEKNLNISGKKQIEEMGVKRFNQVCRDNVLNFAKEWGKTINRVARWVEFNNSYKTMDNTYMESVWWGLKTIWVKDLIYQDRKVLLYCSRCETPISNFEVAMDNSYKEITEESVYVKFKLLPRQRIVNDLTNDKTYVLAWTTTPWTLPGNTALNIGPNIVYVLVEHEDGQRFILAKERLSILEGSYEVVAEYSARSLEGLQYEPLYPGVISDPAQRANRIYLADFVTTTDGTGIVHNAAMYGEDDYKVAKEKHLPRVDMLDHKGHYMDMAPEHLRGVFFKSGDKIILKELKEKGLVYKTESYMHSYPHCYRCATPLYYNALPAWFINVQKVKPELLKNNESVSWYPEHLKHGRFQQGVENAPDWNISRNRFWATASPFWKCENRECRHVVCIGSVNELKEKAKNFSEVYPNFQGDLSNLDQIDLHRPYIDEIKLTCEKCSSVLSRVPEVVDCWVESASMPFAELHAPFENQELFKQRFPADFVVEYIPQTRAWFYVMHVINTMLFSQAPFKNVVTTGTILAEDGTKMSKSKNNYPDPSVVIEKYGADALRFYLLTSPVVVGEDLNFSEKGVQDANRKVGLLLYNVWSFYRMFEQGVTEGQNPNSPHGLDQWVVSMLGETMAKVTSYLDVYDTVRAGKEIVNFINELSTWYVRRSRERMKGGHGDSNSSLGTLAYVLVECSKILAPFMPFLSEFIFKNITGKESVHLQPWAKQLPIVSNTLLRDMEIVREIVTMGLAMRKEISIGVRQPLMAIGFEAKFEDERYTDSYHQLILDELNIKYIDHQIGLRNVEVVKQSGLGKVPNVFIDTAITPELKSEGLARELERHIQDLRKKSSLKIGDLVDVYYNTTDDRLEESLLSLVDRKKTFVNQISKSLEVEVDFEHQAVVDGGGIWIGMKLV